MDRRTRHCAGSSAQPLATLGVPLRPELVEFLDAKSLCHYTACSKACGKDARDVNAWQLLANVNAQVPLSARDASENDARSRVRSQVRRRLLADALAKGYTTKPYRPNEWTDFTYFVRITEMNHNQVGNTDRFVIWEGDLKPQARRTGDLLRLPLTQVWSQLKQAKAWPAMAKLLRVVPAGSNMSTDAFASLLGRIAITVVAIRDSDQAMAPLGRFEFGDSIGDPGASKQEYYYMPPNRFFSLFATTRMEFRPLLFLGLVYDAAGGGSLDFLQLDMEHHHAEDAADDYEDYDDTYIRHMSGDEIRHVVSYLAGIPDPLLRDRAIETMEDWHDIFGV